MKIKLTRIFVLMLLLYIGVTIITFTTIFNVMENISPIPALQNPSLVLNTQEDKKGQ